MASMDVRETVTPRKGSSGSPVRGEARWERGALRVICALAVSLSITACNGRSAATHPATIHGRASTKSTAPAHPVGTIDPVSAAVLHAYRAGWAAYDEALATANAYTPGLPATMVDPLLQKVRANLLADRNGGIVGRGSVVLHPMVSSLTAGTASVVDCTFSSSELVYAATGKPVPPLTPPQHDGVQATLVLTGGVWKVSQQSVSEGKCLPGS